MPSPEGKEQFLFSGLRLGREGVICERSLRALSYLFHGWSYYRGQRPLYYGRDLDGRLPIIEFEKLALFWCRIWRNLWSLIGYSDTPDPGAPSSEDNTRIRFPQPYMLERAKHGKRPQRYDETTGPISLADILYGLQQTEFGKRYFDIQPYVDAKGTHASDYRTEVHPCLSETRRSQLLVGFNEKERLLLEGLDDIVRRLGPLEIRALGTHEDLIETLRDIELEFIKIHEFAAQLGRKFPDLQECLPLAWDMLEYAEEAWKKAAENKENYSSGYRRVATDIKDPILQRAFADSQVPPEAIWSASQVPPLARDAMKALAISKCLVALCFFSNAFAERRNARARQARQMRYLWDEGVAELRKQRIATFPELVDDAYERNSAKLKSSIEARMKELIRSLER